MKQEPKQEPGIDQNTFNKWRKGLKKKAQGLPYVYGFHEYIPKTSPITAVTFDDTDVYTTYNHDIWRITFPKIAEDLVDLDVFKNNVTKSAKSFFELHLPLEVEVDKDIDFFVKTANIDSNQFTGMYPDVYLKPHISGPKNQLDFFMKLIRQWSGFELFWKGSFLKSKSSGKINGIRLTGLSYNIPDKFSMGQPTSYVEKILI